MVSKVNSLGLSGIDGYNIEVETDIHRGDKLELEIVGLPDISVREAKERVKAAIINSDFKLMNWSIIVNLAPANIRKEGSAFDLAIILGILSATGQISNLDRDSAFIGELSLSGEIRPCNGVLATVITAKNYGYKKIYVPMKNACEGSVIQGIDVYGVQNLRELVNHLNGNIVLKPLKSDYCFMNNTDSEVYASDFCDVIGQQSARRACEIAAAGGHNMLFIGPPGAGKSMLAKCLPSILPDMTLDEILESSKIYSIAGKLDAKHPLILKRPFVKTNQSISVAGMTGGGSIPNPGVISMAHNGVLFLDEVAEFSPKVLDSLRQPLEDNCVTISRVKKTLTYPSSFMLVCAMNPCPCGKYGHPTLKCTCTRQQIDKYMGRISGPLLDRIDLQVELPPVPVKDINNKAKSESSSTIKERVNRARKIQQDRYAGTGITCNAKMTPAIVRQRSEAVLTKESTEMLNNIFSKLSLSMRAYDKIIKISQTIADLSDSHYILPEYISEAVYFRSLDKKYWNR